ncbi:hypothetical protein GOODEAATRI_000855 [Goodea atripinnis]|uniref:Antistasin-like domain-containing protein n=1 Tax=Goodea atripinnis TaxID=208336 RepID=A0ABV0NI16_9TELE
MKALSGHYVELMSMDRTKASCWVNNKLRTHEEQWKEDDCTFYDSCPDLGKYCSLQCPMGYEKDDLGCEVCECSIPTPKCRPLTCTKTCPYGYVYVHPMTLWVSHHLNPTYLICYPWIQRNKHGCEMCRCVKCPPFTCDKHCSNGYRQNRKGCNICMCKGDKVPLGI